MARAMSTFNQAIRRANNMLDFAETIDESSLKNDNIRMATVLSVAGMDAYFTLKFRDIITDFLSNEEPGEDLIKLLKDAGLDTRMALELIWMDRPLRRIGTLVERYFDRYTTQRFDAIDDLFKTIGLPNLCQNAEGIVGRTTLRTSIAKLVEKRHEIVHDADINSHIRPRGITLSTTRKRVRDIKLFVEACNSILENRMGQ